MLFRFKLEENFTRKFHLYSQIEMHIKSGEISRLRIGLSRIRKIHRTCNFIKAFNIKKFEKFPSQFCKIMKNAFGNMQKREKHCMVFRKRLRIITMESSKFNLTNYPGFRSLRICADLQGSVKIVALNLEDPYRSARSSQKCADFL